MGNYTRKVKHIPFFHTVESWTISYKLLTEIRWQHFLGTCCDEAAADAGHNEPQIPRH